MICNAVLFMSFKSGFERIKLGFVQIFDHIDMPQGGEVGGKPNLSLIQSIDGSGVELFHRTHHEVFGEDVGMRAGQNGIAFLQKDGFLTRIVAHCNLSQFVQRSSNISCHV